MLETIDPLKRTVILKKDTWENHIIVGNPEIIKNIHSVKNTIENPEVIYESSTSPKRDVFFKKDSTSTKPYFYTKVIVEYNDDNIAGEVKTSFFSKEIKGGINDEKLKYISFTNKLW